MNIHETSALTLLWTIARSKSLITSQNRLVVSQRHLEFWHRSVLFNLSFFRAPSALDTPVFEAVDRLIPTAPSTTFSSRWMSGSSPKNDIPLLGLSSTRQTPTHRTSPFTRLRGCRLDLRRPNSTVSGDRSVCVGVTSSDSSSVTWKRFTVRYIHRWSQIHRFAQRYA